MKKMILTIPLVTALLLVAAPNAFADDPDNPFQGDASSNQDIPKPEANVSVLGSVVQVDPTTITCDTVADFEDVVGGNLPGTNYDGILLSGGLQLAERFAGQSLSYSGNFDVLSESPSSPLALQTGDLNDNVNVVWYPSGSGQVVDGLGPLGYPDSDAVGEGSLAILFPSPQSQFKFDIIGSTYGGSATLNFFGFDGSLLGTIVIVPTNTTYGFKDNLGTREIAGFSIHNTDPWGIGYDNICYEAMIEVQVHTDIKPDSCPNPLNVNDKGVLPVAVLGTDDFDVFMVDPASIRLAGVAPVRSSYEDVGTPLPDVIDGCNCTDKKKDKIIDMVLKFNVQDIVSVLGEVNDGDMLELTLTGVLYDETPIEGKDCIVVISNVKVK